MTSSKHCSAGVYSISETIWNSFSQACTLGVQLQQLHYATPTCIWPWIFFFFFRPVRSRSIIRPLSTGDFVSLLSLHLFYSAMLVSRVWIAITCLQAAVMCETVRTGQSAALLPLKLRKRGSEACGWLLGLCAQCEDGTGVLTCRSQTSRSFDLSFLPLCGIFLLLRKDLNPPPVLYHQM